MARNNLNPQQQAAVENISGPLLVLAGAGSGKTSVIVHKIAYLLQECGIAAQRIIAVTFTNKAAREMQQRVKIQVNKQTARGLIISTFHHLGLEMLRKDYATLGLKSGFTLFDDGDTAAILTDLIAEQSPDSSDAVDQVSHCISQWKANLLCPQYCLSHAEDEKHFWMARVYSAYEQRIRAYNAVDFDDLIRLPTLLLRDFPAKREQWQQRVHYLLVDEYQDTNTSQYQLVKYLTHPRNCFTVVGDDDQSIYSWRGARPENIALLEQDFPALQVIKLEQNYRSTSTILKAANTLIANNPHVFTKQLWSQLGEGDPIRVVNCEDEKQEIEWVAHHILSHKLRCSRPFKDYAVLYRNNHQARLLEIMLQSLQIPYRLSGGTSFFSRVEIKDFMAYLRLLVNPSDDNAFLRIANTPRREIGASSLEKLAEYATERGIALSDAVDELGFAQRVQPKHQQKLQQFTNWLNRIRQLVHQQNAKTGLLQLLQDISYQDWLGTQTTTPKAAERKWQNVLQLVDSIDKMCTKSEEEHPERNNALETAINKMLLRDMLDQRNQEEEEDVVSLMTLHAAKGLEFPFVVLMGVEESILPHKNSVESGSIEEERRLFYVGITRAKQNLTLTYAEKRKSFGESTPTEPSRFLYELPADTLNWKKRDATADPVETKATAQSHLASMRSLLQT